MTWTALAVTAELPHGYATAHPWGIALDGILAAQIWQNLLTELPPNQIPWPSTTANPPDLALPLARCTTAGDQPDLWHWAATCSQPIGPCRTEVHYRAHHLDHRAMEDLADKALPASLSPRSGAFRSRRMPLIVTSCHAVTWSAVGDPDEVARLLKPIAAIGKKRGHGEGTVSHWQVTVTNRNRWEAAHLHQDQTLGRPSPPGCLPEPHRAGPTIRAGLRPPHMHASRQTDLHVPAADDAEHPR